MGLDYPQTEASGLLSHFVITASDLTCTCNTIRESFGWPHLVSWISLHVHASSLCDCMILMCWSACMLLRMCASVRAYY